MCPSEYEEITYLSAVEELRRRDETVVVLDPTMR
jgi:hypothetical protein